MLSCNPCYNGYHVHVEELKKYLQEGCNPCYNGYHVHAVQH